MPNNHVIIIGGGIIGLASAYYLKQAGYDVTIIEKDKLGAACSKGNQGWICPALHTPVPEPGLVSTSLKWLMKKDSPLYIKPSAYLSLSGWLKQFMSYCNKIDFKKGEDALHHLNQTTLSLFDGLKEEMTFEMHQKGMLFLFLNEKELKQQTDKFLERATLYNHEQPIVYTREQLQAVEPKVSDDVIGGLLMEKQRHINPSSLSAAFSKKIKEKDVQILEQTDVEDFKVKNNTITSVTTSNEEIKGDTFLLSAGAWSGILTKKLNLKMPLQSGKGYSITIQKPDQDFSYPMYLGDTKAGVSPFSDSVRIGGTMELSGLNTSIDRDRIQGIKDAVFKYFKNDLHGDYEMEWSGMRPMTPDGLPVIGKFSKYDNMYIASGHGMIGVALAPVTGIIIKDLIQNNTTAYPISPFNPNRFM